MNKINFIKLTDKAIIPTKAHPTDAGFDMIATSKNIAEDYIEYGTGIAMKLPSGYCALLFPRSSNSNKDLLLCNSVGVVDSNYIGEIKWRFKRITKNPEFSYKTLFGFVRKVFTKHTDYKEYEIGDRIGQMLILPIPKAEFVEVKTLPETDRSAGGFGSTGTKAIVEPETKPKPTKPRKKKLE